MSSSTSLAKASGVTTSRQVGTAGAITSERAGPQQSSQLLPSSSSSLSPASQLPQTSAAEQLLAASCACPLESFVRVLPASKGITSGAGHRHNDPAGARRGILRYVGPTDFADGVWAGVELVGTLGRNNGFGKATEYFKCLPGQGVFVRPELIRPYTSEDSGGEGAPLGADSHRGQPPQSQQRQEKCSTTMEEEEKTVVAAFMAELEKRLLAAEQESDDLRATLEAVNDASIKKDAQAAARLRAAELALEAARAEAAENAAASAERVARESAERRKAEESLAALLSAAEVENENEGDRAAAASARAEAERSRFQEMIASLERRVQELQAGQEAVAQHHAEQLRQELTRGAITTATKESPEVEAAVTATAAAAVAQGAAQFAVSERERILSKKQLDNVSEALADTQEANRGERDAEQTEAARLRDEAAETAQDAVAGQIAELEAKVASLTSKAAEYARLLAEARETAATAGRELQSERARFASELSAATRVAVEREAAYREQIQAKEAELTAAMAAPIPAEPTSASEAPETVVDGAGNANAKTDAIEGEAPEEQLASARAQLERQEEFIAALTAERDELQEMCDMQESELIAQKAQADEATMLLQQLTEDAAVDQAAWTEEREVLSAQLASRSGELRAAQQEAARWRRQCQMEQEHVRALSEVATEPQAAQDATPPFNATSAEAAEASLGALATAETFGEDAGYDPTRMSAPALREAVSRLTADLDTARMRIFQLEKAAEAFSGLKQELARAGDELAAAKRKAKVREQRLTDDYEETLAHVRGTKDRAQHECAQLRTEVARLEDLLLAAGQRNHSHDGGEDTEEGEGVEGCESEGAMHGRGPPTPPSRPDTREGSQSIGVVGGGGGDGVATYGSSLPLSHSPPPFLSAVPLSDWERGQWERMVRRREEQLLSQRTHSTCGRCGNGDGGCGAFWGDTHCSTGSVAALVEALESTVQAHQQQVRMGAVATTVSAASPPGVSPPRVLDFSTPVAREASARTLIGTVRVRQQQ